MRLVGEECLHHCSRLSSWAENPCAFETDMKNRAAGGRGLAQALKAGDMQKSVASEHRHVDIHILSCHRGQGIVQ